MNFYKLWWAANYYTGIHTLKKIEIPNVVCIVKITRHVTMILIENNDGFFI